MKKLLMMSVALCLAFSAICGGMVAANAQATEQTGIHVNAKSAVLMDYDTGTVVFTQNETERMPIASMVKIMTLLLTFEEIDAGRLHTDDMICVSENAASMGGSQAFLDAHSDYAVNELIKSIVVGSANDSCVALAEHIAGSVDGFVLKMNEKAHALGMDNTQFCNCTGLPGGEQYCCARDVAVMTRALLRHVQFYDYAKIWMFDFAHPSGRVTQLANTNKLIRAYEGCDGGKTGFTNEAKYCLSATAKRGETRLISVVCGAESSKVRNAQNAALFNYGFANYETRRMVTGGVPLEGDYEVAGGKEKTIKAVPEKDCFLFVKKGDDRAFEYAVETLHLCAPVRSGDVIGTLSVKCGNETVASVNLVSDRDIKKSTYIDLVDEFIANW